MIVGIDLGTTNSEVAVVRDGVAEVLAFEGERIMPSVVGVDAEGRLLVGTPARNQQAAYPERTVRSVKRLMGSTEQVRLGERELSPSEVSALVLRELVRRAEVVTGERPRKAVITVPAFFQDAQRQATRAAGEIAGLEVVRIVNEPTAAALAYGGEGEGERLSLIYDLGGGTFDVSIVTTDGTLTEVLASHGDVHLGGDDFDRLLADDLAAGQVAAGHPDPRGDPVSDARLLQAAQAARHRLTEDVEVRVREEFLGRDAKGAPVHLDLLVTRERLEELITPLVEKTLDSVDAALGAAGRTLSDLDEVILVGGATRTPLVAGRLAEVTGLRPRLGIDPDTCVALGASTLAGRLAGHTSSRVLVDVTPYSFGPSAVGQLDGRTYDECYIAIIEKNTPLPVTRSDSFFTMYDNQEVCDIKIFQGESRDARQNILVGRFRVEGLAEVPANNEIVCKMVLDLDGLLTVEAVERRTGLSKKVTIEGATARMDDAALEAAHQRTRALWGTAHEDDEETSAAGATIGDAGEAAAPWRREAASMLIRVRSLKAPLAPEDAEEICALVSDLEQALQDSDADLAKAALHGLDDLLYYAEQA